MIKSNGHFSCLAEGGYRQQGEASGVGEGYGGSGVYAICRSNVNMMGCGGERKHAIGLCRVVVVVSCSERRGEERRVARGRQKSPGSSQWPSGVRGAAVVEISRSTVQRSGEKTILYLKSISA